MEQNPLMMLNALGIILVIVWERIVHNKIRRNQPFDGLLWGLLVGCTTGILWSALFYASVSSAFKKVPNYKVTLGNGNEEDAQKVKSDLSKGLIIGSIIGYGCAFLLGLAIG